MAGLDPAIHAGSYCSTSSDFVRA